MACKILHRVVGPGFIPVGVGDQGARVVGHDELGHAAIETQCPGAGTQPVEHGLAWGGAGKCVARCAQRGHEDVGAAAVGQAHRGAGEVDKQFLAGAVDLAHGTLEGLGVTAVVLAELRVAVDRLARVLVAMLLPQQHQRHAFAAQFLVHAPVVGRHETAGALGRSDQPVLQGALIQSLNLQPVQAGGRGQADVLGDNAFGDAQ